MIISPQSIIPEYSVVPALWPLMPWGPAIDGTKVGIPDQPLKLLQEGKFNKVPAIFGTNKNEGSVFVPAMLFMIPGVNFPPQDADIARGGDTLCTSTSVAFLPSVPCLDDAIWHVPVHLSASVIPFSVLPASPHVSEAFAAYLSRHFHDVTWLWC